MSSVARLQELVEPLAGRMQLEPVADVGGDERPPAAVGLDPKLARRRALDHGVELVLVEREPEVVDAGAGPTVPAGRRR